MDERTKRLRKAVENSGYSQTQLCEITGINKEHCSYLLREDIIQSSKLWKAF